jgi:hypothetical protein
LKRGTRQAAPKAKGIFVNLGIVVISLIVSILVAELILRTELGPTASTEAIAQPDSAIHCRPDSILGWRFAANTRGRFRSGRYWTPVEANTWGIRNREVNGRDTTCLRVLVLGDSYAFGWGVTEEECFPRELERLLRARHPDRRLEVINGGLPGFGIYQQWRMLRLICNEARIDVVISTFSLANDPVDDLRITRFLPDRLAQYSGDLKDAQSPIARLIRRSRLLSLLDRRTLALQFFLANLQPRALSLSQEYVNRLAATCCERDFRLLLVIVPHRREITDPAWFRARLVRRLSEREVRVPLNIADSRGIPVIDLTETLEETEHRGGAYLKNDPHWTPAAHRAVAMAILRDLPEVWFRR